MWRPCNDRLSLLTLYQGLRRAIAGQQIFLVGCMLQHRHVTSVVCSERWQRLVPRQYISPPLVSDAVRTGHAGLVDTLANLAAEAMLVLSDAVGNTCLHEAAAGPAPLLYSLLSCLPPNAALRMVNTRLEIPLHLAVAARRVDNIHMLASFDCGSVVFSADEFSGNALQRCVWLANVECLRELLRWVHPSELFQRCASGYTTLMVACLRGDYDMARYLIEVTKDCYGHREFLCAQSSFGQTCLHVAVMSGNERLVMMLAQTVPPPVLFMRNIAGQSAGNVCVDMQMHRAWRALEARGRCFAGFLCSDA